MSLVSDEQVAQQMCDATMQDISAALRQIPEEQRAAAWQGMMAGIGNIIALTVAPADHDRAILHLSSFMARACKGRAAMDAPPAGNG